MFLIRNAVLVSLPGLDKVLFINKVKIQSNKIVTQSWSEFSIVQIFALGGFKIQNTNYALNTLGNLLFI